MEACLSSGGALQPKRTMGEPAEVSQSFDRRAKLVSSRRVKSFSFRAAFSEVIGDGHAPPRTSKQETLSPVGGSASSPFVVGDDGTRDGGVA